MSLSAYLTIFFLKKFNNLFIGGVSLINYKLMLMQELLLKTLLGTQAGPMKGMDFFFFCSHVL